MLFPVRDELDNDVILGHVGKFSRVPEMEDLLKAGDYGALADHCEQEELKVSVVQASGVTDDGWQMQKTRLCCV